MNLRVFAPAKVNLTLQVGSPRGDGLHPLQSVVMFADIGDWIEVSPADRLTMRIHGDFTSALSADRSNLVSRAAHALADAAHIEAPRALLILEKNLPVAAGLGGGSSDAAATLKALNVLWELGLDQAALLRIAGEIGADVAVCMGARSAWVTGTGEALAPLHLPALHTVLVNPLRPLSTAAVFAEFDRMELGAGLAETLVPAWRTPAEAWAGIALLGNGLDAPARALMPRIEEISMLLHADPRVRCVGLSGSGATMFALAEGPRAAEAIAADVARAHADWWVRATKLGAA